MTPFDEELQKNIESGNVPLNDDPDAKAYQQVFNALKKEPDVMLSASFADKVLSKIEAKRSSSLVKDYVWLITGLVLICVVFVIAVYFSGLKPELGFLEAISGYKGIFIFGALFIGFLQWIDKLLIKHKTHH